MNTQQNPSFNTSPQTLQGRRIPFVRSGGCLYMEEWKRIYVDGEKTNYKISNEGRVKSVHKIRKLSKKKTGYIQIVLCINGKVRTFRVHRLVSIAFHLNPENKPHVNHINGIKDDNRAINLEWCTQSENEKHAFRTGLKKILRGSLRSSSKLKELDVVLIKKSLRLGIKPSIIAKYYSLHVQTIYSIKQRRSWRHIK